MVLIVLFNLSTSEDVFAIDYRVVSTLLLGCLLPVIVYHDRKFYSINDAFYLIGGIFFLGIPSYRELVTISNSPL